MSESIATICVPGPFRYQVAVHRFGARKWESVGVDRVNFLLNAIETVPQEEVLASMRLFAKEVMPKFASKREPAGAAAVGGA